MNLTPQQHAAIHRIGQDACVIAGPGSGKTRVLAERFAWLVAEKGISPRNILALTFTEKAANEIRARVAKTNHPEIDFAPISTFHGLCKRILSEFAIAAGMDPATELWDERVASAELHAAAEEVLNDAAHNEKAALRKLFETWNTSNLIVDLCGLYEKVRSLSELFPQQEPPPELPEVWSHVLAAGEVIVGVTPTTASSREFHGKFCEAFRQLQALGPEPDWAHVAHLGEFPKRGNLPGGLKEPAKEFYELVPMIQAVVVTSLVTPERNYLIALLHRISARYDEKKLAQSRMDFHDLEHRSIALLRNNAAVREELRRRFEHILMDEMQDTNPVQWQLLDLLRSPGTFFAVGDVNQSIYGFRFAAPKEFEDYRDSIVATGGEIDYLGHNFRSREDILHFTETVSAGLGGIATPGLVAGRKFTTQNLAVSMHPFEENEAEFAWIAAEIEELRASFVVEPKGGGPLRRLALSDIAILVRTSSRAESIAAVLAERGIAFTLGGGRKFFDTQEVADCISFLELLANPRNTIARAAVLRSPLAGMSDDDLLERRTNEFWLAARERMDDTCPDRLLIEAMDASGYWKTLNPGGKANVEKLLRIIRELWQQGPRNMRHFVEELEQMRVAAQEKSAPVTGMGEAVQILTVHASKGLEFPVVFVAGAYFTQPGNRATLKFGAPDRVGVRWTNPVNGEPYADIKARLIDEEQKAEEEKELQRQLYVALTRAEQRLYVSWAGEQKRGWVKWLLPHIDERYLEGEPVPLPDVVMPRRAGTLEVLRKLEAAPARVSSATVTSIGAYRQCPRRYFLDEIAGLRHWPGVKAEEPAANLGTEVHQLLAGMAVEAPSEEAVALAAVVERSDLNDRLAPARWVERELDLVFAVGDLVVEGQVDLCFEDEHGQVSVIDFKTGGRHNDVYDVQMALYREGISRMCGGAPVRSWLYFLRKDELVEATAPLDSGLMHRFTEGSHFDPNPGYHCAFCPHSGKACAIVPPIASATRTSE